MFSAKLIAHAKELVLDPEYDLSVAEIDLATSRQLNKQYRGKDKPANVLSFPLSATSGEILLCPEAAGTHSPVSLLIHGLYHLKGYRHGSKMSNAEATTLKLLQPNAKNFNRRPRHRNHHD
jgi:probable rRNA maturation factor